MDGRTRLESRNDERGENHEEPETQHRLRHRVYERHDVLEERREPTADRKLEAWSDGNVAEDREDEDEGPHRGERRRHRDVHGVRRDRASKDSNADGFRPQQSALPQPEPIPQERHQEQREHQAEYVCEPERRRSDE
jgi:hypothetical protein